METLEKTNGLKVMRNIVSPILKQTLRDFFSPVANIKYIISAIKGTSSDEDHKQPPPAL